MMTPIKDQTKAHFGRLAEEGVWASLYDDASRKKVDCETWPFLIRARRVIELLEASGREIRDLLDCGCGTAPIAESVLAMGARYTGVDFSQEMIDAARKTTAHAAKNDNVRLDTGDITALNFPPQSFDAVVAMGVLEYLEVEQIRQVLEQIRTVLKPGGITVLTIPKIRYWGRVINHLVAPISRAIRWRPYAKATKIQESEELQRLYMAARQLDELCHEAGLVKIDSRHYNAEFVSRPFSLVAQRLSYILNRPFELIAQIPGGRFLATGYIGMYRNGNE